MSRFDISTKGITLDSTTGLTWTTNYAKKGEVTFDGAQKAIEALNKKEFGGFTDWRLPTVQELFGLVDHARYRPAINAEAFKSGETDWVWTSTPLASSSVYVWGVYFSHGYVNLLHRDDSDAFVRAVRGGASPSGQ